MSTDFDVIVLGAGMAGLSAARALAEAGVRVIVLEGTDRVGGRIHTVRDHGNVVELGAEFIHGRPAELWKLIEEAGVESYERTGQFFRLEAGTLVRGEDDGGDALEELKHFTGPDCSFAAYLDRLNLSEEEKHQEISYVEGFNAADAREASALALGLQQKAEDEIEGDRLWKLAQGYDQLIVYLRTRFEALGGTVLLGAPAIKVSWSRNRGVSVTTADKRSFSAARCVVTVPLRVLQARAIQFEPGIPSILAAADRMRMGHVCRFVLTFRHRLWPEPMSFLLAPHLSPAVWWTSRPADAHTLTGWSGGPPACHLLTLNEPDLRVHALGTAAAALGRAVDELTDELISFHTLNWTADAATHGAYSWVPVGGVDASVEMTKPVHGVLFFAGEHTDLTGHWGTVHAALRSGLRASEQVLEMI